MSEYDVLVRGGTVVRSGYDSTIADVAITGGRIAAVGPGLAGSAAEEIDARDLWVFPGAVDAHVHFNDPGRAEWEGFATGTAALAAGGTTTFCDMPLNASPPTLDGASFDLKRQAAEGRARVDFGLWGGLVPGNLERLGELAERGVVGLKAFMTNSGIADFPMADEATLWDGMVRAAELGLLVAVHAEDDAIITRETERFRGREGYSSIANFLASRPTLAEARAIQTAIILAARAGCRLHIVHVSSRAGVDLVAQARGRYLDVSCETCPHYLVLTEDDVQRLGAVAKCAPPLRDAMNADLLWSALGEGLIPMVASDHSPAPPAMKAGDDFFQVWGGISGCQHLLPMLLTEGCDRGGLALGLIAERTATFPAARFGLARKGRIAEGYDGDLALLERGVHDVIRAEDLRYRHQQSPYVGRELTWRVVRTLLRGATIYRDGQLVGEPLGRLVRPGT
ncbi:MAG TPA: allantoinase AllB [Ktedonobacterales bacterium]|nr:allantoinase AllB [Ktedonobacterales bacterium]